MNHMKKHKNKRLFLLREALWFFGFLVFLFSAIVSIFFIWLVIAFPLGDNLYTRNIAETSLIYDRTGEHILYEIHGEENRKIIGHDQIPDTIRIATIATEDASFYDHHGIDFLAILRALRNNIRSKTIRQGASTITQQLARNAFLSREKKIERKIKEAIYAVQIENKYSKDEILDAYLNQVPYGSNAYGIQAAAQTYFKKNAINLTLDEAVMLAALTKAPTTYSPYGENKEALIQRQKEILEKINQLNLRNSQEVDEALKINTLEKVTPLTKPIAAPHFVFYVRDLLEKKYGKNTLEQGGLKIYTTLDWEKQEIAQNIIQNNYPNLKKYGANNMALVAIDPRNGQILTMIGSIDYFNSEIDGQVNVTTRPRQPGSSFKPIVYAASFEKGFQPETLVLDAKTNFGPDGSGRDYIPNNYDGKFHGILSMRQALAMSLNIPAIKTLREVGLTNAIEMAHRLGITTLNQPERYGLSLVIGGGEVTLLDETSAFSVFANDGQKNFPDPLLEIRDKKNNVIYFNKAQNSAVLYSEVARKINSILSDNSARVPIFGPNNKLFIPGRTVAAKTGTTQEWRDAWTIGYTPQIAVGVWAGNNDNHPMHAGADGSYVAAPVWNKFMTEVLSEYPNIAFAPYNKSDEKPSLRFASVPAEVKNTYYKLASGKEISKEKAEKMSSKKIRVKTEFIFKTADGKDFSFEKEELVF